MGEGKTKKSLFYNLFMYMGINKNLLNVLKANCY